MGYKRKQVEKEREMMSREEKRQQVSTEKRRISAKKMKSIKKHIFVYSLLAIPLLHFFVFWVAVNIESLFMPFQDDITGKFTLDHFKYVFEAFKSNGELGIAVKNTIIYWVTGLFVGYVMGLSVAYFLYKKIFMYRIFTFLFMIPSMVSGVVLTSIYKNIVGTTGPIAVIYENLFNKPFPALMYTNATATWTIVAFTIWTGFGGNIILFSGTMSKIPQEIVEAAQIDGAGFWREFFSITFPLIKPTIYTMLIFSLNGLLMASGPILLFSGGMYETTTISYWFYEKVIVEGAAGVSSAFGLLLTCIGLPLVLFTNRVANKVEVVEY